MPKTTTISTADEAVKDFSTKRKPIKFRLDDDVFEAAPTLAADLVLDYAAKAEQLDGKSVSAAQQREVVHDLFNMVLLPESAERFIKRLSDPVHPIDHSQITEVMRWLFEEYGLRPTPPDSASSTGSGNPDGGTSSTVSTSPPA